MKDFVANIWNIIINFLSVFIYWFLYYFKLLWFVVVLIIVAKYCISHWDSVVIFQPFSGNSLFLCVLIFLVLFPLLTNFKVGNFEGSFCDIFNFSKIHETLERTMKKLTDKTLKAENNREIEALIKKIEILKLEQKGGIDV